MIKSLRSTLPLLRLLRLHPYPLSFALFFIRFFLLISNQDISRLLFRLVICNFLNPFSLWLLFVPRLLRYDYCNSNNIINFREIKSFRQSESHFRWFLIDVLLWTESKRQILLIKSWRGRRNENLWPRSKHSLSAAMLQCQGFMRGGILRD